MAELGRRPPPKPVRQALGQDGGLGAPVATVSGGAWRWDRRAFEVVDHPFRPVLATGSG